MNQNNPEIDLLIIESLGFEFKGVSDIADELQIEESIVSKVLTELFDQGLAIEKKGALYRIFEEEED